MNYDLQRERLVERELRMLGVRDEAVLQAMRKWIWFDETSAVSPLTTQQSAEHEPPHPFAVVDR